MISHFYGWVSLPCYGIVIYMYDFMFLWMGQFAMLWIVIYMYDFMFLWMGQFAMLWN